MDERRGKSSAQRPPVQPEVELLLCCARSCVGPEVAERIRMLLQKEVDWAYLLRLAAHHGVTPLLYQTLDRLAPEAVPASMLDELRLSFLVQELHNRFLSEEMVRIVKLLEKHKIPAVPFKGPVLAAAIYSNPALRHISDLDILVYRRDVLKARRLLSSHGYRPARALTGPQEAALLRCESSISLVRTDGAVLVEIHWAFTPRSFPFSLNLNHLVRRLKTIQVAEAQVRSLSPEDMLLVLCVHGTKHVWEALKWICDVAELIRVYPEIQWEFVWAQAKRLGSMRMLLVGLTLAQVLLGAPLPAHVSREIQNDPQARSLAASVLDAFYQNPFRRYLLVPGNDFDTVLDRHAFCLLVRERWSDRIRYRLRHVFVPNAEKDLDRLRLATLPRFFFVAYYLVRPLRLIDEYGSKLLQWFSRY